MNVATLILSIAIAPMALVLVVQLVYGLTAACAMAWLTCIGVVYEPAIRARNRIFALGPFYVFDLAQSLVERPKRT